MATLKEFSPDYEQLKSFLPQNSTTGPRIFIFNRLTVPDRLGPAHIPVFWRIVLFS